MVRVLRYIGIIIGSFWSLSGMAQEVELITQQSGDTYVYQKEGIRPGVYLEVYRKEGTSEYQKINKKPIEPVKNGVTFQAMVGESLFQSIQSDLGTDNSMATFLNIRNNPELQRVLSFSSPGIAEALGYLFIDETSELNKSYTYKIVRKNISNDAVENEQEIQYTTVPTTPDTPQNVGLSIDTEKLKITWSLPSNQKSLYTSGFNIYAKKASGTVTKLNKRLLLNTNEKEHSFIFSLPFDNTTYDFFVRAQDMTGQESESSEMLTMTLKDQTPPSAVAGLVANSRKGSPAVLTWRVGLENDLMGYNVYRAPRSIDEFVKINKDLLAPFKNFYEDKSVEPGQKYAYAVVAVDSAGNESAKTSRATLLVEDYEKPDAPLNLRAEFNKETEQVALNWEYAFNQQDFRTFQLTRQVLRNGKKSPFETVNPKVLRETNYVDRGPTNEGFIPGYVYRYHVISIDSSANRSDTTSVEFQIPDLDPPVAPEINARNDDGHRVNITWTASPDYDVVGYKIYRSKDGVDTLLAENHYSKRLYRDETAVIGNTYVYAVSALDSLGNEGPKSVADTVFMKDFNPPSPTRNVFAVADEEGVDLTWEQVPDNDLSGYRIYKSTIATGIYELVTDALIQEESYTDTNGSAGNWYKVKAVDSSGNEAYVKNGVQAINTDNQ